MLQVVDVELTPNPHALKFLVNQRLLRTESRQYAAPQEAQNDPLASGVFAIEGVVSVFYMDKFITIEKAQSSEWGKIQRPFVAFLSKFDLSTIPPEKEVVADTADGNEMLKKINEILNQKVRPALAHDGGGLEVLGMEGLTLKVRYQGACGTCPSSINGTLTAIESLLKKDVNPSIEVTAG
ncbi:MAG: hypothetical protein AMXMBFR48_26100 [Ignavibacteriales bacterium]